MSDSGYCPEGCTWPHDHRFEADGVPWPSRYAHTAPQDACDACRNVRDHVMTEASQDPQTAFSCHGAFPLLSRVVNTEVGDKGCGSLIGGWCYDGTCESCESIPHFTQVAGGQRCGALNALDVPTADESRLGVVSCDRAVHQVGMHRIGSVVWSRP